MTSLGIPKGWLLCEYPCTVSSMQFSGLLPASPWKKGLILGISSHRLFLNYHLHKWLHPRDTSVLLDFSCWPCSVVQCSDASWLQSVFQCTVKHLGTFAHLKPVTCWEHGCLVRKNNKCNIVVIVVFHSHNWLNKVLKGQ